MKCDIFLADIKNQPPHLDEFRLLLDRNWPRGISRRDLSYDYWAKDFAPSVNLSRICKIENMNFQKFEQAYRKELNENPQSAWLLTEAYEILKKQKVLIMFSKEGAYHNHAIVFADWLISNIAEIERNLPYKIKFNEYANCVIAFNGKDPIGFCSFEKRGYTWHITHTVTTKKISRARSVIGVGKCIGTPFKDSRYHAFGILPVCKKNFRHKVTKRVCYEAVYGGSGQYNEIKRLFQNKEGIPDNSNYYYCRLYSFFILDHRLKRSGRK